MLSEQLPQLDVDKVAYVVLSVSAASLERFPQLTAVVKNLLDLGVCLGVGFA